MRRRYPGRPIEKGPPPGQLKKREREIYGNGKDRPGKQGPIDRRDVRGDKRDLKGPADRGPSKMDKKGGPAKSNDRGGPVKSNNKGGPAKSGKGGSPKGKKKP